ncbi:hypothetical protein M405DRAFT_836983 [Rhizopogon salebrosus TDB-379]|nr:hypothetical protein M405DRAFT_836983 [Rhizopogon salebrosus TDB-379]
MYKERPSQKVTVSVRRTREQKSFIYHPPGSWQWVGPAYSHLQNTRPVATKNTIAQFEFQCTQHTNFRAQSGSLKGGTGTMTSHHTSSLLDRWDFPDFAYRNMAFGNGWSKFPPKMRGHRCLTLLRDELNTTLRATRPMRWTGYLLGVRVGKITVGKCHEIVHRTNSCSARLRLLPQIVKEKISTMRVKKAWRGYLDQADSMK